MVPKKTRTKFKYNIKCIDTVFPQYFCDLPDDQKSVLHPDTELPPTPSASPANQIAEGTKDLPPVQPLTSNPQTGTTKTPDKDQFADKPVDQDLLSFAYKPGDANLPKASSHNDPQVSKVITGSETKAPPEQTPSSSEDRNVSVPEVDQKPTDVKAVQNPFVADSQVSDNSPATDSLYVSAQEPPPKPKTGKKMFVALLGVVLLIAGLSAALILIKKPQDIRQKAQTACDPQYDRCLNRNADCTFDTPQARCDTCGWENQGQCGVGSSDTCFCNASNAACDPPFVSDGAGGCKVAQPTPTPGDDGSICPGPQQNNCAIYECPQGCTLYSDCCSDGTHLISPSCPTGTGNTQCALPECKTFINNVNCASATVSGCGQIDYLDQNNNYCGVKPGTQCTNGTAACSQPDPSPNPSPSTPPAAACRDIRIYKVSGDTADAANWTRLTADKMAALQPGETIYVTTFGQNATFDKARIRVNSNTWLPENETTSKKPKVQTSAPDEYYVLYTIPTGTLTFNFGAEVHNSADNKWY